MACSRFSRSGPVGVALASSIIFSRSPKQTPLLRLKQLLRRMACREKSRDSVEVADRLRFMEAKLGAPGPRLWHFSRRSFPVAARISSLVRWWPQLDRALLSHTEDSSTCSSALMPTSLKKVTIASAYSTSLGTRWERMFKVILFLGS